MVEIIPSINVKTFEEVRDRVKLIESWGLPWAQLDIFDGIFTHVIGFNSPEKLRLLKPSLNLEAHLMIWEPDLHIHDWIASGVKRIFFHYEATFRREFIIDEIKKAGLEVGVALKPATPWGFAERFIPEVDVIQILGVDPGPYGQEFQGEEILDKIKTLKEAYPKLRVEVDGGVNDANIASIVDSGADLVVAGSYLFNSPKPKEALKNLRSLIAHHGKH